MSCCCGIVTIAVLLGVQEHSRGGGRTDDGVVTYFGN